jgi:hypothetical protein
MDGISRLLLRLHGKSAFSNTGDGTRLTAKMRFRHYYSHATDLKERAEFIEEPPYPVSAHPALGPMTSSGVRYRLLTIRAVDAKKNSLSCPLTMTVPRSKKNPDSARGQHEPLSLQSKSQEGFHAH